MSKPQRDEDDLKRVETLLDTAGLSASRVPVAATPGTASCDLRANDQRERYLIEVKGLHDDEEVDKQLREGKVYSDHTPIAPAGSVSKRIDQAVKQLRETTEGTRDELRLVALIDRGIVWSGIIMDQIIATLYGIRTVVEVKPDPVPRKCLYFSHSAFRKRRRGPDGELIDEIEWDGAIILLGDGAGLCVNDASLHAKRLCESRLGRWFTELGFLHTAERIAVESRYLIADCDIDRRDQSAILKYLAGKYGLTRPVVMQSFGFFGGFSLS